MFAPIRGDIQSKWAGQKELGPMLFYCTSCMGLQVHCTCVSVAFFSLVGEIMIMHIIFIVV